jgi:hypothetical protein
VDLPSFLSLLAGEVVSFPSPLRGEGRVRGAQAQRLALYGDKPPHPRLVAPGARSAIMSRAHLGPRPLMLSTEAELLVDGAIVVSYFAGITAVGLYLGRRDRSLSDFALAGGR